MRNPIKSWRSAWPIGIVLSVAFASLLAASTNASAQTALATPQDKRGIGLQSGGSASNSTVEQQAREAKPELILQTGYGNFFGATRLVFSPDGRLLATATARNSTIKLWETATGRELRNLSSGTQGSMRTSPFVAFSRDSRLLAATAGANLVKIWDVTSGRKLQTVEASQGLIAAWRSISFLAFTADGRKLVAISDAIRVWDVATWHELSALDTSSRVGFPDGEGCVAVSPDSQQLAIVVTEDSRPVVKFLDLTTGRQLRLVNLPNKSINNARVSYAPDGRLLVSAIVEKRVKLWELSTKETERDLGRIAQDYGLVTFSREGRLLALSEGDTVKVWHVANGREVSVFKLPKPQMHSAQGQAVVSLSDDGKIVATGGFGTPTVLWEAKTGKQLLRMNGRTNMAFRVAFSAEGTRLSSGGRTTWDLRTGSGLRMVNGQSDKILGFPSPDGRLLATFAMNSSSLTILESPTGRELQTLAPSTGVGAVQRASFSPDGTMLVTTYIAREKPTQGQMRGTRSESNENQTTIWDVKTGSELQTIMRGRVAIDARFNSDGHVLAILDSMGTVSLWDTATGNKLRDVTTNDRTVTSFAFSPDGRTLAIGGENSSTNLETVGLAVFWDIASGRQVGVIEHGKSVTQVAFSRDGRLLASSSTDNTIKIWDVGLQRELRNLVGHNASINSIDFSPNSRLLASASDDGSTFLWDTSTGEHLLTLISLDDGGEWMVVTPQGLFDGTPLSWNQILWRYNHDTFNVAPIEWFFNEFYYPGLLADVFAGKRPYVAQDVSKKDRRQPTVKLALAHEEEPSPIASRTIKVKIDVTDALQDKDNPRGCGAWDLRLFRNGSLVKVWPGDVLNGRTAVRIEEEITIGAGANRLTAYAFNRDNVKSKDAQLTVSGADNLRRGGTAYIVAVGLNEYANAQYNLKYAVADAQSFSDELRLKLSQVSRFERVQIVPLINENATKANVLSALKRLAGTHEPPTPRTSLPVLDKLKRAAPEDAVIIFFAGHGTAQAQHFYLIPHDLGYTGERTKLDEQGLRTILTHSISDMELEEAVEGVDAGHLLLFIDACNSGQALEAGEKRRGPMNSKGLAQLAYEKGMYILTAAQSYQAALEAAQLGHGLLTYALVEEGLKTAVADREPKDGVLRAREWLDFATERVPQMQEEKMRQSRGIGLEIAFAEGEQNITDPQKRSLQRPRVFYRRELEANPLVIVKHEIDPNTASLATTDATATNRSPAEKLSRWLDLQTATLGVRYRFLENSQGLTVANQLQHLVQFKGRFKFDQNGNYSVNAGIFTGNNFVAGFNDTGIGTGRGITNLYLKQLYFSSKPVRGVEVQFGGLYFNRGESTEITTYDNDGYLMGERVVLQRPKNLFFDEISATYAFLDDLSTPNINKRWHGLGRSNYHQFLVRKKIGERGVGSADYTFHSGTETLRQAVRVSTPEFKVIDLFRLELYQRVGINPDAGLAAYVEKVLMKKRLTLGGGYAQIDHDYGGLNADRFNRGKRFFFNGSYSLSPEFTVSTFYTRAFGNDFPISNRTRFELLFSYNLLRTLKNRKLF
ncbi:MAG: caspase family protein [Pyrinomonadaceae bacterium]